jgi:hypothetical protein
MSVRGTPGDVRGRIQRGLFVGWLRRVAQDPDARGVDEDRRVPGQQRLDRRPILVDASRRALERGVHDRFSVLQDRHVGLGRAQFPRHRGDAARAQARGLFGVADERGHLVSGAHERLEDGRTDVAGCAS